MVLGFPPAARTAASQAESADTAWRCSRQARANMAWRGEIRLCPLRRLRSVFATRASPRGPDGDPPWPWRRVVVTAILSAGRRATAGPLRIVLCQSATTPEIEPARGRRGGVCLCRGELFLKIGAVGGALNGEQEHLIAKGGVGGGQEAPAVFTAWSKFLACRWACAGSAKPCGDGLGRRRILQGRDTLGDHVGIARLNQTDGAVELRQIVGGGES